MRAEGSGGNAVKRRIVAATWTDPKALEWFKGNGDHHLFCHVFCHRLWHAGMDLSPASTYRTTASAILRLAASFTPASAHTGETSLNRIGATATGRQMLPARSRRRNQGALLPRRFRGAALDHSNMPDPTARHCERRPDKLTEWAAAPRFGQAPAQRSGIGDEPIETMLRPG